VFSAEIGVGMGKQVRKVEYLAATAFFHCAHDGPNCGIPVVLDERLIERLLDVHPRELEEGCEESFSYEFASVIVYLTT